MQNTGIAQNWAFAGVNFSLLVILVFSRPYEAKIYNFVEIASEIFYLLSNAIIGYVTINDLSADVNFNLGWIIITCLGGIALVHFSLVLKDVIKDLTKLCKKKSRPHIGRLTTKVTPIINDEQVNDTNTELQTDIHVK